MIPFSRPTRAPAERGYVEAALASGRLAGDGPFTARATAALEALLDGAPALLTTSGTHALELAALLLDLGPDDEVILPSFTFSSTANAVALRGARLRFADIDPGTWSMERPQIEAARTPRSTVVMLVHYGGVSRDVAAIRESCAATGLRLVEDAAHALFARFAGQPLGTFGALGALSFHATKNLSAGEGGALILNDPSLRERALVLREKGTDRTRFLRGEVDRYTWQDIGSSYLPSDLVAALLLSQLEHAEVIQRARQAVWARYAAALAPAVDALGVGLQQIPAGCAHPAHVFGVLAPPDRDRDALLEALKARGVYAVSHYEPLHRAPACRDAFDLPVTDDVARRMIRLPLHAELTDAQVDQVIDALVDVGLATR